MDLNTKLDPRLRMVLELPSRQLRELCRIDRSTVENQRSRLSRTRRYRRSPEVNVEPGAPYPNRVFEGVSFSSRGEPELSVMVRFQGDVQRFDQLKAEIGSIAGNIAIMRVKASDVATLARDPDVSFIELARPLRQMLDQSVPAILADQCRMPPLGLTGKGVVVGVIDMDGLDFHHPDLLDPEGKTRVELLWDQRGELSSSGIGASPATPSPSGTKWSYGVEYTAANLDADIQSGIPYSLVGQEVTLAPGFSLNHSTHITGIAAGNGNKLGGHYAGVATEASIIFVNAKSDSGSMCDAIDYIFAKAGQRPCVINISLGYYLDPHDGTTLAETFIDSALLTSEGVAAPGRAVVVAAGNRPDPGPSQPSHKHVAFNVAPSLPLPNLVFRVDPGTMIGETIEIWYEGGGSTLDAKITSPNGKSLIVNACAMATNVMGDAIVTVTSTVGDPRNGDNVIQITLMPKKHDKAIMPGDWKISLTRSSNTTFAVDGHAWIDMNTSMRWFTTDPVMAPSDSPMDRYTVAMPGTSTRAITVGNYVMDSFRDFVSHSSTWGPSRDGRMKPEFVAPGAGITAPRGWPGGVNPSPGSTTDMQYYSSGLGTSQAAPHVAGLTALIFQAYGDSPPTSVGVKAMLEAVADPSAFIGTIPVVDTRSYGNGRVRAPIADLTNVINLKNWVTEILNKDVSNEAAAPMIGVPA